jgi:hypothetical protein
VQKGSERQPSEAPEAVASAGSRAVWGAVVHESDAGLFPPRPIGLKGRVTELATLSASLRPGKSARIALVGSGGSGKSMLACAVGHRVKARFAGGVHWFRSGPWDARTLAEMLAIRFRVPRGDPAILFTSLCRWLGTQEARLIVLDNHENDAAVARLLNELGSAPVTWVLTARRCLLSGVTVFPVIAPQAIAGKTAFSRVRALTPWLRQNPLALDMADALVRSGATTVDKLRDWLSDSGVADVRVIDHEDDLPEVSSLVEWAWKRLERIERRMMTVLAETAGDHVDAQSLAKLAGVRSKVQAARALARLRAWHLVQTPFADRYALHAVVRCAVSKRTRFPQARFIKHYIPLLERSPDRLDLEQTHLYAAMDYAHAQSNLAWMLRIERLLVLLADKDRFARGA